MTSQSVLIGVASFQGLRLEGGACSQWNLGVTNFRCLSAVDGGERAVIFDRFRGVLPTVSGEGTHFLVPWVQKPILFSIRSKPRRVPVVTGSKGKGRTIMTTIIMLFLF